MKLKLRNHFVVLIFSLSVIFFALPSFSPVFADNCSPACEEGYTCQPADVGGIYQCVKDGAGFEGSPEMCDFATIIVNLFNIIIAIFPFAGLAILMLGAFLWATASSDPQKVQKAQQTLTYGVVGLIVGLSAIAIIGTLQMILIGNEKFKWLDDDGFMKVDFCFDEYQDGTGANGGAQCFETQTVCGSVCCESNETCVREAGIFHCE